MQKKVRFGVLGYANIAKKQVIPAILEANNATLYALASQNAEKRREAKERFGFEKVYDTYQALLQDEAVDAVYIPLPNSLHRHWAIQAMRHKKHVLCEKPLAPSLAEAREMVQVSQEEGVLLMEAFMYRFTTCSAQLKALLDEQAIGEIKHISSTFRFHMKREGDIRLDASLGGGSLWDVGCYPINLIGQILKQMPEVIQAVKVDRQGVDFALSAVMRYPNEVMAVVNCGFDAQSDQTTEINGTEGSILMRDSFFDSDAPILVVKDGTTLTLPVPACKRYVLQVEAFSRAVLTGGDSPLPLSETLHNIALIERILQVAQG